MINVNAAGLAKGIIDVIGAFVVVCHSVRGGEKAKVFRFDADCPKATFGAEGAIATPCAFGNVCVHPEFDCSAMAASIVRFCYVVFLRGSRKRSAVAVDVRVGIRN